MDLQQINSEKLFTSKYLVEQINLFRKEEGNGVEVEHSDLLKKIQKEFDEEIGQGKISPTSYLDASNRQSKCYELNFEQSLQILMSESKTVRKRCVDVMKEQQKQIEELKKPKLPTDYLSALKALVESEESKQLAEKKILELQPKADFYDQVADTTTSFDMQEVSALLKLKIGRNILFKKLRESKVLMDDNLPYRKYIDSCYFVVVETKWLNPKTQQTVATTQTRITQKGLEWLTNNKDNFNLE